MKLKSVYNPGRFGKLSFYPRSEFRNRCKLPSCSSCQVLSQRRKCLLGPSVCLSIVSFIHFLTPLSLLGSAGCWCRSPVNVLGESVSAWALPVFCPAGWRRFGCSCYLLSSSMNSWEASRAQCLRTGSDLVTISSQEEMLGAQLKFWIGLKEASRGSGWKWTDGSSPGVTDPGFLCSCAAFNRGGRSWSEEWCSQLLQWVCEKKASTSGRLQ
uniref:C-type lectin domain-containing protein n=1 Tax=Poecilia latipinna TaxID=48699 RepID=A0A3B3UPT8_9TELE